MLVLSRKVEDIVKITVPPSDVATEISIKVVDIRPKQTRLGFEAPRYVSILRDEISQESQDPRITGF